MQDLSGNERGEPQGLIPSLVAPFMDGKLSILLIGLALVMGLAAILGTPREEEPQIVVPMADIFVAAPGASAEEVERLVSTPLERNLWQVDGVEYVYSVSERGRAVVTVRFFVGEDREDSLVKLHNRITAKLDEAPSLVRGWVIKPVEIDDVPIVTLTLSSETLDDHALRRIGEEALARLDRVPDVSRTRIVGGRRRELRVELDPAALSAYGVTALEAGRALASADAAGHAGSFARAGETILVESGPYLRGASEVEALVVAMHEGRPVYLRDVATVREGPEEARTYTRIGVTERGGAAEGGSLRSAVTLAIAKKKGTNAVAVAHQIQEQMVALEASVLPDEVSVRITRDYGATADEKVDDLLFSLGFAMVSVVGLLIFTLGWREGLIVALAVPVSFALALAVNLIFGYTINRVTLFALILTLGLVVDDPITNIDNIQRHIVAGVESPRRATLRAVQEVLPPVILSTLTVIVSFLPLFFITGMMGPYMGPMAVTVPLTVTFSTLAALTIVPWACFKLLRSRHGTGRDGEREASGFLSRIYSAAVDPFLASRTRRWALLLVILLMLAGCGLLVVTGRVPMKMLPFNNKDELQLVLDLPEGTPLEATDAVVRDFEAYLFGVHEVVDFEAYVGTFSPIDFNGLVRHHYFREREHLADIRLNLLPKDQRPQSHDIALRIRDDLQLLADRHGAVLSIVESPPGPPVLATLVGEVTGPPNRSYRELIAASGRVVERLAEEPGVVDIDAFAEAPQRRLEFVLDREKAALHGIDAERAAATLRMALTGSEVAVLHRPEERHPLGVRMQLSRVDRSGRSELGRLPLRASDGELVQLAELGSFVDATQDPPIYHKNLERVVFVVGDVVGRAPAEAVLALQSFFADHPLPGGIDVNWAGEGEWDITLRVFRDLGLAFGAALLGIYLLLVVQTGSFLMPLLIMTSIPLTAIGILPGFWLLNLLVDRPIGGYDTPVFFTATAMIGMIALGGIVVRNSIVLIEFIGNSVDEGLPLREAILKSGAVRMRPILLTAATTALGAWPITMDPVFSGLAWALIFGLLASTVFSLLVVPVGYFAFIGQRRAPA